MQAGQGARGDGHAAGNCQHPGRSGDRGDGQEASEIRELVSALEFRVPSARVGRFDRGSVSQLAGTYRPKGRGSGGEQDRDRDQEPEGHRAHSRRRGEEPAGQLDERVRLAGGQTGALPGLHGR